MLAAYADLIDGVRSYYAKKEGDDWVAAFSAAMLFSVLFLANLSAIIALVDLAINGELVAVVWLNANRLFSVGVVVTVSVTHVYFSKKTGVYYRRGGPRFPGWGKRLRIYIAATVCNFVLPSAIILTMRWMHD